MIQRVKILKILLCKFFSVFRCQIWDVRIQNYTRKSKNFDKHNISCRNNFKDYEKSKVG